MQFIEKQWPLELLAIILAALACNFAAKTLLVWLRASYEKKGSIWRASFAEALFYPLSLYIWFFTAVSLVYLLDHRLHDTPFFGQAPLVLLIVAGIISLGWFALRWKNRALASLDRSGYFEKAALDKSRIDVIDKLLTIVIFFFIVIWLFQATGQNINAILTLGGISAAALGFASKEFIANFFGGFMIYLTRPFKIGDMIKLEGKETTGTVEEIGWYLTRIRDLEKLPIYIPNSMFSQFILVNITDRSHRLIKETIGIRYCDFGSMEKILREIREFLSMHPAYDFSLPQGAYFTAYGNSSLDLTITAYTKAKTFQEFNALKEELLLKVRGIVVNNHADFPFQTITIDSSHVAGD